MLIGRIGYSARRLLFWRTARASKPGPTSNVFSSLVLPLAPWRCSCSFTNSHLSAACAHERAHPSLGSLPTDETRVGEEAGAVVPLLAPAGRRWGGFAVILELSQTGPADEKKNKKRPLSFYYAKNFAALIKFLKKAAAATTKRRTVT